MDDIYVNLTLHQSHVTSVRCDCSLSCGYPNLVGQPWSIVLTLLMASGLVHACP